jgi:hypothetical protein
MDFAEEPSSPPPRMLFLFFRSPGMNITFRWANQSIQNGTSTKAPLAQDCHHGEHRGKMDTAPKIHIGPPPEDIETKSQERPERVTTVFMSLILLSCKCRGFKMRKKEAVVPAPTVIASLFWTT